MAFRKQLAHWSVDDVARWVGAVDEGDFADCEAAFRRNEVDGKELITFQGQAELQECGVESRPRRKRLWALVETLFREAGVSP